MPTRDARPVAPDGLNIQILFGVQGLDRLKAVADIAMPVSPFGPVAGTGK
jgi:hypothetical protein